MTIDEYIAGFPLPVQDILQRIRLLISSVTPDFIEVMSYQMPTFRLKGKNLVHFAAWKHHIGFYPTPSGTEAFAKQLAPYKFAKGSVRFPLDQPIPYELIKQIVHFRVSEISK